MAIKLNFLLSNELLAVLFFFFKLPVFVEIFLFQFANPLAEALGDLSDVRAGERLLLPIQLAVCVVHDITFLKNFAGVLPFGQGDGLREVLGPGADASAANELRTGIVDVGLALPRDAHALREVLEG